MKIYAQGRVRLDDLISVRLPISDWRNAFDLCMDKKALKILITPRSAAAPGREVKISVQVLAERAQKSQPRAGTSSSMRNPHGRLTVDVGFHRREHAFLKTFGRNRRQLGRGLMIAEA